MPAPIPQFLPQAFAQNAAPGFRNDIPDTTIIDGRASFNLGFPPLTMTPIIAGGVPPFGQDVNGILYALSTHAFASQAGQPPLWSQAVSDAIGGYALGTVLGSTDGATLWFNILADNTSDPDDNGAGWVPSFSYGIAQVAGVTGGTVTLTTAQARQHIIQISGALVANAAVVLPDWVKDWIIVNSTTGAFTLTVRTESGTGVEIPQGGFTEPVGVYGDGTNIYRIVTPLSIPTSVTAAPDTYVLRDNLGDVYARAFRMTAPADNLTLTDIVYVTDGGTGLLRRMSQANFRLQLFFNPALTGTPTAPTPAAGDASTRIATTAFIQQEKTFGGRVNSNGTANLLPSGWSSFRVALGQYRVTHNRGDANYAVTANPLNDTTPFRNVLAITPSANFFTVYSWSETDGTYNDQSFQFALVPV